MFESTTGVFERQHYTVDITGLASHARDTLAAYLSRAAARLSVVRRERHEAGVGRVGRYHADYHVPDSVRVR
ncbi:hypothetical protein [Anaerosoma tenue]|uniref:hypothetical protein n=1 Tax=Anaerosoma tenue TaxID=2933588 RepID=UPI002260A978|nr:hypothetical protein [Anaerosoma tenue]MCK8115096.1 hypothetical protein [Anaerosoma tenue]